MNSITGELLNFLAPKLDDPLQVGFLLIIVAMIGYTVISTHQSARPASWEKKWNRGTPDKRDDDLAIEHGSVTDLWHAVATAPEKLAEIMPGMLLVVGLLGTFLGLGMALDHASNILSDSSATANGMGDLTSMLQGLGTKFKTSTWGIMGFVLLKIWSEATRFDEKRLTWVIDKVKADLERDKAERLAAEKSKQQNLLDCITRASTQIVDGVQAAVVRVGEKQNAQLSAIDHTLARSQSEINASLMLMQQNLLDCITRESNHIVDGLQTAISRVGESQQTQLAEIDQTLTRTQSEINASLMMINESSQTSSQALTSFSAGTRQIIQQMADAAKEMAEGSNQVSAAAKGLENVVDEFGSEFKEVLDKVRKDLGNALETMSDRSSATMKEGSEKLNSATKEISKALGELSTDVKNTMHKVEVSISTALDLQKKSSIEFTNSTQTLNENIETTTQMMKQLGKDITSGMSSIAEAGQRMGGIGKNLDSIGKRLESQVPLLENLAIRGNVNAMEEVAQSISRIEGLLQGWPRQGTPRKATP